MAVHPLLNIGGSALSSTQTAINVTGNNVANVNTEGYCRQTVRFEEINSINSIYGRLGQGVNVSGIVRNFERFVEDAYLAQSTMASRWDMQSTVLQTVQSLFNESNKTGISNALNTYFNSWQDLSLRPDDGATREALLADTTALINLIKGARDGLDNVQQEMNSYIHQTVDEVNSIVETIQKLNEQIATEDGRNSANDLRDKRDLLVRDLSDRLDITVNDKGGSNFTISTANGLPLLDANHVYKLELQTGRIENNLVKNSAYDGTMSYSGEDTNEYTFEVVTPPDGTNAGSMRVSLDGGRTWLRNDDGTEYHAEIPQNSGQKIKVKDLEVAFTGDPAKLTAGDTFEVIPYTGLYWDSPTRPPLNITPQVLNNGTDNQNRISGGTLGAFFNVRDHNAGRYEDKLDAMANSLIWEVNRIHSQGATEGGMKHAIGTYKVDERGLPLGVSGAGLPFGSRLTEGNISFQIYDANGDPIKPLPDGLDFDTATDGIQNFDPQKHSINDVANAINNTYGAHMQADVIDGRLQLTARGNTTFAVNTDSAGLMAGLGINTFFDGMDAKTLKVNEAIVQDTTLINTGKVNSNGLVSVGDNAIAKDMYGLASKEIKFSTGWENVSTTLGNYYNTTVSVVGADTRTANINADYNTALAKDLDAKCNSISGVNLDEEMTSLIKFQHSYTAAAKLITTADQMLQTILGMKQ